MDHVAATFNQRTDRTRMDEMKRMKSLLDLFKAELLDHDQAELARFEWIKPTTF
jgi:hypothetical protein